MSDINGNEIAVIGMAGRFPGASGPDALWTLLAGGREGISDLEENALLAEGVSEELLRDPSYVRRAGVLQGIEWFAPARFGLTAFEAERMDPQHRLFLETAWEALEHAALAPRSRAHRTAVFAGAGYNGYLQHCLAPRGILSAEQGFGALLMNMGDFLSSRVAYALDFTGPAVNVQSACSTSLLAVHLACQSLLAGEADVALAGGVTVSVPHGVGYLYQPGMILAPDGRCRPFDALARGTVPGNGCGVVVLRLLEEALAQGDPILAVLRGSAANNDGAAKIGFTAPSADGQAKVIAEAWEVSGLKPATAGYIEAHGTGTELGDPIELKALARVFGPTAGRGSIGLGSVKSNIGHADAAAGIAGLIKTILCLRHGQYVPTVHFTSPNPRLDLEESPFFVPAATAPWPRGNAPRRAGVSAFGIGGTNVHVVVEEAPPRNAGAASRRRQIFPVSAASPEALGETCRALAARLMASEPQPCAEETALTLQTGREALLFRRAEVADDIPTFCRSLLQDRRDPAQPGRPVAFLFTGQGSPYPGMGAGLYVHEAPFREMVDRLAGALLLELGLDAREFLGPDGLGRPDLAGRLGDTALAQPLLFVLETALAALWRSRGVLPRAMLGHSVGELAAACVAGVFSPEEGALLAARRGRLMADAPEGGMAALALGEEDAKELLAEHPELDLAAVNALDQIVVSGAVPPLEKLLAHCRERRIPCARLAVSRAFHSRLMDGAASAFASAFRGLALKAPALPWVSNETGQWIEPVQAVDPAYWCRHIRSTVRFSQGLEQLFTAGNAVLLELGPADTLARLAQAHPGRPASRPVVATLPARPSGVEDQAEAALAAFARLWEAGVELDWSSLHGDPLPGRVSLPPTVFPRQRYWIDPIPAGAASSPVPPKDVSKRPDPGSWLYAPVWSERLPAPAEGEPAAICILGLDHPLGRALAARLEAEGRPCLGIPFTDFPPDGSSEAWSGRLAHLGPPQPLTFLDLTPLLPGAASSPDHAADRWLFQPMEIARALSAGNWPRCRLVAATQGGWRTLGTEQPSPWPSLGLAAAKILPLEFPELGCEVLDLDPALEGRWEALASGLLTALRQAPPLGPGEEPLTTCRNGRLWRRDYAPFTPPAGVPSLSPNATCLITGGLGGVGLTMARHLAEAWGARIILLSRRFPPPRDTWATLAEGPDPGPARLGRNLLAIEAASPALRLVQADVADEEALSHALAGVRAELGPIHGCLHCAGLADYGGMVLRRERGGILDVLRPKVHGSLALLRALRQDPLEFLLLCSSLGNICFPAKFGQIAYAAACEFQDGLAEAMEGRIPRILAVNWDDWTEAGMSVEAGVRLQELLGKEPEPLVGLTGQEGMQVLERIMASGRPRLVVSVRDLAAMRRLGPEPVSPPPELPPSSRLPRPDLGREPEAPSTRAERVLADLWRDLLGLEEVGVGDDFFALGGHSLLAVTLCQRIEAAFKVRFPPARLIQEPTIRECARHLEAAKDCPVSPLISLHRGDPGATPLFLLHGSDGDALAFRHLAAALPEEMPVHSFCSPRLQGGPPLGTIEAMAEVYLRIVRAVQPRGPYRLAGLSMGGVVAFEMAHRLLAAGETVSPPIMFDTYAPASPGIRNPELSPAGPDLRETCQERLQVTQDNLCALYAYLPRPLEIPGVLIKASRQAMHVNAAPDLGWNTFFPAGLDIHTTPGDHFTLMHPPHVQEVARIVLACLDRSRERKQW